MAKLVIDGRQYDVKEGKNLLEVCLSLGLDVPYFCWHPALGSVGACRQCAVKQFKDKNDTDGKLVMSCMEPVSEGTIISIADAEAVAFRKGIIEWLMVNHPHDCPVCDEGGECHLQDMTVMTGHNYRRFRFNKRTYRNQYLGPLINHEMNRCIQCYRCVRFYRDYAGGRDLDVFAAHDHVYFGRHADGILENEFSGNLVEICPTGVFTDKTLKSLYTRKWDLTHAPSVCAHCSVGCNTIAGERYGELRRILSRYNGQVNGYFLCDRGRFGYGFVNHGERIGEVVIKDEDGSAPDRGPVEKARFIGRELKGIVAGIGSPRASLEANFMLSRLADPGYYFAGESKAVFRLNRKIYQILSRGGVRTPSLKEIEKADAVLILGEDLTNTAPMMALAVRQAARNRPMGKARSLKIPEWHDTAVRKLVQDEQGPVFTATPYPTRIMDISSGNHMAPPGELAAFGFAIARMIDGGAPSPPRDTGQGPDHLAERIAGELMNAENPLIISGTGCLNAGVIEAAYNIAKALKHKNRNVALSYAMGECNSLGLAMMAEKDLDDLAGRGEEIGTLIVLENDLYRRARSEVVDALLERCGRVIVLDSLMNPTTRIAHTVIPAGTFAESQGTYVNNEGRAQRFFRVFPPAGERMDSWKWLGLLAGSREGKEPDNAGTYESLVTGLAASLSQFRGIDLLSPPSHPGPAGQKIARQPARYSGRTAMEAHRNIHEPRPPEEPGSPLSFSMEGFQGIPPSSAIPFFWSPGWNSVQAINKYQIEVGGPLHGGDPGLRLIEPGGSGDLSYFQGKREDAGFSANRFIMVARHHIFGGEELSSFSGPVAELAPAPYAGIGRADAEDLGIRKEEDIRLAGEDFEYVLPIRILEDLPRGMVLVPFGLKDFTPDFSNPYVTLKKKSHE